MTKRIGHPVTGEHRGASLMSPMVMAMLFRELFGDVAANPPDSPLLADQHARTALRGLLMAAIGEADGWRMKWSRVKS